VKINYCGSESLDQHQNIGYCPQKTVFIPNGFDTQSLLPSEESRIKIRNELGLKKSTRIIGIIGRYSPMKDHANFLKAAAFLAKKKADVQFIMAGRNVDSQNDELTSLD
jgi:glycosyltransferase involved in cell wall biosynthesis